MSALEQSYITPEQYLEMERKADFKSEYYAGQIFVMSGGSAPHSIIGGNIFALIWVQLRSGACTTFNNDMKVKVSPTGLFTYPDVSVVCGEVKYADETRDMMENPTLIVEVLSPSTQDYDRGEKFIHYQSLDSLTDYLLVSQDVMRVEHFVRQGDGQWLLSVHHGPESLVKIVSISSELRLADVYLKVQVSAERNAPILRIVNNSH